MRRIATLVAIAWRLFGVRTSAATANQSANVVLPGVVREAGTARSVSGVRVVVISGPDTGAIAISDAAGRLYFQDLRPA
jgi:hypothetical protein